MKTSESKPKTIWAKWREIWLQQNNALTKDPYILQAMQEYAESYHKEKLKNDLIHFASQRNEQHFLDWESKYMISVNEINDFLNTKE
jgi:hypothetical protein